MLLWNLVFIKCVGNTLCLFYLRVQIIYVVKKTTIEGETISTGCACCSQQCLIECGKWKCFAVLSYLGEKHNCSYSDEGFYDDDEGSKRPGAFEKYVAKPHNSTMR